MFEIAIVVFEELEDNDRLAKSFLSKKISYGYSGEYNKAAEVLNQGETLYQEKDNNLGLADIYHEKGHLIYLSEEDEMPLFLYHTIFKLPSRYLKIATKFYAKIFFTPVLF